MSTNPYEPPRSPPEPEAAAPSRDSARRQFRTLFFILCIPALYNFVKFDIYILQASQLPGPVESLFRSTNIFAFALGGGLIWAYGFALVEWIAGVLRYWFAPETDAEAWKETLYASVPSTIYLGVLGAILWAIWVFGFYTLRIPFMVISQPVGVLAHLLAALWYLPLIYRWWRLARPSKA